MSAGINGLAIGDAVEVLVNDAKVAPVDPDMEAFEVDLREAFEQMVGMLLAKRRSYGPGNLVRFGPIGIVIRASDKIDRLANLCRDGAAVSADGDTVEDAWRDLIGYGVLGLLERRGRLVR